MMDATTKKIVRQRISGRLVYVPPSLRSLTRYGIARSAISEAKRDAGKPPPDMFQDARDALRLELFRNNPPETVSAIEALIDLKIEALADRIQDALGVRP